MSMATDVDAAFRDFATKLSDEAMRWGHKAKAERGLDGLISIGVGEALMRAAHMARDTAIAIEAQRAVKQGAVRSTKARVRRTSPNSIPMNTPHP
jgi:hypothetical protein